MTSHPTLRATRRLRAAAVALALLAAPASLLAQSGPWARYDAKMKGEALIRDADGGDLREIESIVLGGGDVNWRMEDTGLTPLMAAASGGHAAVVRFLLDHGADAALRDSRGMTALDRAARQGAADVVAMLRGTPAASSPPVRVAPAVAPPSSPSSPPARTPVAGASATRWDPFGAYRVGDRVLFWLSTGWRTGTVREVGAPAVAPRSGQPATSAMKYRIADDRYRDAGDWYEWGRVAAPARAPFWTGFFVGDWSLGETMGVNSRVEGHTETTTFSYGAATQALHVDADGTWRWRRPKVAELRGRWTPAPDGPGIVLAGGAEGATWTLRNESNAIELGIRGAETARLTAPGKMSVAARRPAGPR